MEAYEQRSGGLDYDRILAEISEERTKKLVAVMLEELPYLWCDVYRNMTPHQTDICRFTYGTFEYIFDAFPINASVDVVSANQNAEARLVAVLGNSNPLNRKRDDSRLRGWIGRTESFFGRRWDKGHFIAHSIGGAVDGIEANVFVQRRDLNRGWSAEGKVFRAMEKYCFLNPGTFCFNRPLYTDCSARPAFLEFGVLKNDGKLWVEHFDNH
ncbi:MAG: hypothetical protein ACREOO_14950 [bacterium]